MDSHLLSALEKQLGFELLLSTFQIKQKGFVCMVTEVEHGAKNW